MALNNNLWRISCITKIAASIDNNYTGPQVTSVVYLQKDEYQAAPSTPSKSSKTSNGSSKNTTPDSPPISFRLEDGSHLQGSNPMLFSILGPSNYTTSKKAAEEYKARDFSLHPRFDPRRPPEIQVEEYIRFRLSEWKSKESFRKYWNRFFDEMYLNTIEAKAPVLLSTQVSGSSSLEKAQYALYATQVSEYFDYYSKKLDSSSDKLNQQLLTLSSDSNGPKKSIKRKRSTMSSQSSSSSSSPGSNQSTNNDDDMMDDTREQQLLSLTTQMNELRLKFYDPEILAFNEKRLQSEAREASRALKTDSEEMRKKYLSYAERFQEAVDEVFDLIKLKRRANDRKQIFGNLMNNFLFNTDSAPRTTTSTTTTTNNDSSSSLNGGGYSNHHNKENEEDEDEEEEEVEGKGNTETVDKPIAEECIAVEVAKALETFDCLTCCEVALKIVEHWQRRLKCWDQDVVDSYIRAERMSVEITEHLKKQSEITQTLNPFNPETLIRNLRPFATTFFWTRIPFSDKLLTTIKTVPHWSLALVRALSSCERLAIHFNRSHTDFSVYLCGQDPPVARSAIRHLLHFLQPAFDNDEGGGGGGGGAFEVTLKWLRRTVLLPSPPDVFERLSRTQTGAGNLTPVEFIGYTTASNRFLRFASLTSPNKWTISDEDWAIAITSLAMQTNHLVGSLKEQRVAFITNSKNVTEALADRWFLKSILNTPVTCFRLYTGQEFVCQPKESILYCLQNSKPDSLIVDTAIKTKAPSTSKQSELQTSFAGRPWLNDKEQSNRAQVHSPSAPGHQSQRSNAAASSSSSSSPPYFWLCNRTNIRQWIDTVSTLKRLRAVQLGRWWHDLEFCPTAVDLSIWMARVLRDFFDAPDESKGQAGSMLVVLPRVIQLQLQQLVSCDDSDNAAWQKEWLDLGTPRSTDVARRIILTVASDIQKHKEELGDNGCIILVHAEATQLSEWDLICRFLNRQLDIEDGQDFTDRLYLLYNPVLGGFSNKVKDDDAHNIHMLVSYSNEILVPSIEEFRTRGRQLPSHTWIYPPSRSLTSSTSTKMKKKNRAIEGKEEDEEAIKGDNNNTEEEFDFDFDSHVVGKEEGQIKKALIAFCNRMLTFRRLNQNNMPITSIPDFIQGSHSTNRDWIKGPVVNYLGRLAKMSLPRTPHATLADNNSSLLMTQIQNNIPVYGLVEHWVNADPSNQVNVLAANEATADSFISGLSPLRLANALARSPPKSFAFPSRLIWDRWVSYWLSKQLKEFLAVVPRSYPIAIHASTVGKFNLQKFDDVVDELIKSSSSLEEKETDEEDDNMNRDLMEFDTGLLSNQNQRPRSSNSNTRDTSDSSPILTTSTTTTTTTTTTTKIDKNNINKDTMEID